MAKIECNTCGELIDVTASSVVLPYVCPGCLDDGYGFGDGFDDYGDCTCENCEECESTGTNGAVDYAGQKYEDMAPAVSNVSETHMLGYLGKDGFQPAPVDDCGTPLGNTTEQLIADLRTQLEGQKARADNLDTQVRDLENEIAFCDKRVAQFRGLANRETARAAKMESLLNDYRKRPEEQSLSITKSALAQSQKEVLEYQEKLDKLKDVNWGLLQKLGAIRSALAGVMEG